MRLQLGHIKHHCGAEENEPPSCCDKFSVLPGTVTQRCAVADVARETEKTALLLRSHEVFKKKKRFLFFLFAEPGFY